MLTISSVFATRDFLRMTSNDGHTLVRLIISNPERIDFPDLPQGEEWYRVVWQIQGLQPLPDAQSGQPVSQHGIVTLSTENFDPLSAMLFACYSIRTYLEQCPEGRAGLLKWKDVPEDPTWGLPAFTPFQPPPGS